MQLGACNLGIIERCFGTLTITERQDKSIKTFLCQVLNVRNKFSIPEVYWSGFQEKQRSVIYNLHVCTVHH
jgi:hypothetical protein